MDIASGTTRVLEPLGNIIRRGERETDLVGEERTVTSMMASFPIILFNK